MPRNGESVLMLHGHGMFKTLKSPFLPQNLVFVCKLGDRISDVRHNEILTMLAYSSINGDLLGSIDALEHEDGSSIYSYEHHEMLTYYLYHADPEFENIGSS